jgi:hypothetical protein
MLGLKSTANGIALDKTAFSCCDGQGIQVTIAPTRSASQCSLMRRWSRISSFLSNLGLEPQDPSNILFGHQAGDSAQDGSDLYDSGLHSLQLFCRDHLDGLLRRTRGQIIDMNRYPQKLSRMEGSREASNFETSRPRLAMLAGAILIWHFDACVLPFRMGHSRNNGSLGPTSFSMVPVSSWDALLDRSGSIHKVIMVDGVSELWHPNRLELMEALISYASERRIPLWIFEDQSGNVEMPSSGRVSDKSFRSGVNKRLSELRGRSAVDWITAQARSRLSEVCEVAESMPKDTGIPTIV